MMPQDEYMQPDALDPVLDDSVVLAMARTHLASLSVVTAVDETGGEARAYVIDGTHILKTQRPNRLRPRTSLEKAVFYQDVLAREAPEVSVPRILGYGRKDDIEYVLETRMPGVAMRDVTLDGAARQTLLADLGRFLRRIHSLSLGPFDDGGLFPGDRDESEVGARIVDGLRSAAEANAVRTEDWPFDTKPGLLVERLLVDGWKPDLTRCAVHANPGPEHVFVDPASLRFQGVIDFGDAYTTHPTFDMRRWSSPADRVALIEGYGSEAKLDERFLQTWQAVVVGSLMATIAGLGPGASRPERRQAAVEDLRAVAADL